VLLPNLEDHVIGKQLEQIRHHDKRVKHREFVEQDIVNVRNHNSTDKWSVGTVVKPMGPRSYLVRVGRTLRIVHVDHLLKSGCEAPELNNPETIQVEPDCPLDSEIEHQGLNLPIQLLGCHQVCSLTCNPGWLRLQITCLCQVPSTGSLTPSLGPQSATPLKQAPVVVQTPILRRSSRAIKTPVQT
jgi:hypothetical protein